MRLLFYKLTFINKLKEDLSNSKFLLCFICFSTSTPFFLSLKYYNILNFLKTLSKKTCKKFVFCFYTKYLGETKLNALFVESGKVKFLFGESFISKSLKIRLMSKLVYIYFYFDVFSSKTKNDFNVADIIVGLDNFKSNITNYTKRKFKNKLIFVGLNLDIVENKNKAKKQQNVCKYFLQI